jgi:tricorn protease
VDGGTITVPTFGIYSTEGAWMIEGHGVEPDIEVLDDPALTVQGKDPQLDRALKEVEDSLKKSPLKARGKPAYPNKAD